MDSYQFVIVLKHTCLSDPLRMIKNYFVTVLHVTSKSSTTEL